MVTTTLKPNNHNSPKMRRIRVHVVLILILASLSLAVYWVNGVLSESTDLFVKKLESTSVLGQAKIGAYQKLATLDERLFENPNASIDAEVAKTKHLILTQLKTEKSGFIASLYIDFFLEADEFYKNGQVKNQEWELLREELTSTVQMNRDKWLNEIEKSKRTMADKTQMPLGTQEIHQIMKHVPGSIDFESTQRKTEETILFLLNRARDTLSKVA